MDLTYDGNGKALKAIYKDTNGNQYAEDRFTYNGNTIIAENYSMTGNLSARHKWVLNGANIATYNLEVFDISTSKTLYTYDEQQSDFLDGFNSDYSWYRTVSGWPYPVSYNASAVSKIVATYFNNGVAQTLDN
ncbi:MAG: hypothetical protein ACKO96_36525, partial [Flammeovirgaceae bacterium]